MLTCRRVVIAASSPPRRSSSADRLGGDPERQRGCSTPATIPTTGALRAVEGAGDCSAGETHVALGGPNRGIRVRRNRRGSSLGPTVAVDRARSSCPAGSTCVHGKVNIATVDFDRTATSCRAASGSAGRHDASTRRGSTWRPRRLRATSPGRRASALQAGVRLRGNGGGSVAVRGDSCPDPVGPRDVESSGTARSTRSQVDRLDATSP